MCGRPGRTRIIFNHNFFLVSNAESKRKNRFSLPIFSSGLYYFFSSSCRRFFHGPQRTAHWLALFLFSSLSVCLIALFPFSLTLTLVLFLPLLSPSPPHPLNSPALRLPCHFLRSPAPSSALLGVCVVALAPCHSSVCAAAAFPLPTPVTSLPGPFLPTFFFSPLEAGKGTLIS